MMKLDIKLETKKEIIREYRLDEIIHDDIIKANVAFTLQYVHFNLDLLKTYALQKSLRAMTCKQLLINTFSVLEGIMFGAALTFQMQCNEIETCRDPCELYLRKDMTDFIRFDEIRSYLRRIGALDFSEQGKHFIVAAKDLRNNIHIGKTLEVESENMDYSVEFIDESLSTIREVSNALANFIENHDDENQQYCLAGRFRRQTKQQMG
ncbi:MAG: hypothetical protein FWG96_04870 [Methanomassiliicoccaceae archaeon]|nr:hypothetical protein [Methanomassiliicoccaceae archaeon]